MSDPFRKMVSASPPSCAAQDWSTDRKPLFMLVHLCRLTQRALPVTILWVLISTALGGAPAAWAQPITGVEQLVSLSVPDCDGLAVGDIDGDDDLDLLTSASQEGAVFWFEQRGSATEWRRHTIYTTDYDDPKIEGNALGDFDDDGGLEAVSLDQRAGQVLLHDPEADPTQSWNTVPIQSDRPILQDALVADVNEDDTPVLVYTWEGDQEGQGGINLLTLTGVNPLTSAHWQDRALVSHESAWWLAPRLFDLGDTGTQRDLIYTARHLLGRNPASHPGLFWLEAPHADDSWTRHSIDERLPHPLHVDAGQLTENGPPHDLVVGGFEVDQVYWYEADDDWHRHALALPSLNGTAVGRVWNVKTVPLPGRRRDAVLSIPEADGESAMVLFQWRGDGFEPTILRRLPYGHAMEDRILLRDLVGDDTPELIIADSGGGALRLFRFRP